MSGSQDPGAQPSKSSGRSNEAPYKAALGWILCAVAAAAAAAAAAVFPTEFFMNDILPLIEGVLEWPQLAAWTVTFKEAWPTLQEFLPRQWLSSATLISAMCSLLSVYLRSKRALSQPDNIQIDHTFGTTKSATNKYFLCSTTLELDDLQETDSRWILGKITNRATKQSTAEKSSFATNWHNYSIIKLLSGPTAEVPTAARAINLTPGALWCVLGDLPDNEIPSEGATEVARQGLELSPIKRVAQSKWQMANGKWQMANHQRQQDRSTSFLINIFQFVSIGIFVALLAYTLYERYNTTQLEHEESLRKLEVEKLLKIEELKIKEKEEIRTHEKDTREAKEKQLLKIEELKIKEKEEIRKHEKDTREAKEKQENMEKEENRFGEKQAIAKTDWTDMIVKETPEIPEGLNMLADVKEFHSCKAWEDIDKDAYNEIIENMAKTMDLSHDRKEELILATHASALVNAVEEFDQNKKHSYAKYQILKRPSGNMDLNIALHVATFNFKPTDSDSDSNSNSIAISDRPNNKQIKTFFKVTALETFKEECPQHLFLDKTMQEQKQDRSKVKEKENEEKKRVKKMEEEEANKQRIAEKTEKIKIENEAARETEKRMQRHKLEMERLAEETEKIKIENEAAREKLKKGKGWFG